MRKLLQDKRVQVGAAVAVLLGVVWFFVAGGDKAEEATATEDIPAAVVAPANVEDVTGSAENSLTGTSTDNSETTETTDNTNQ